MKNMQANAQIVAIGVDISAIFVRLQNIILSKFTRKCDGHYFGKNNKIIFKK